MTLERMAAGDAYGREGGWQKRIGRKANTEGNKMGKEETRVTKRNEVERGRGMERGEEVKREFVTF